MQSREAIFGGVYGRRHIFSFCHTGKENLQNERNFVSALQFYPHFQSLASYLRFNWSLEATMTSRKKIHQEVLVDAWRNYDGEKVLLQTKYSKLKVNKWILAVHSPLLRLLLTDLQR